MQFEVRWADIDANFHVRHSVYYDWAATTRLHIMQQAGISIPLLQQLHVGPILFREEAIFKREIHLHQQVTVTGSLYQCRRDYSRWSVEHQILINNEILAAIVRVDGAFIDTHARKLAVPNDLLQSMMAQLPKSEQFIWQELT